MKSLDGTLKFFIPGFYIDGDFIVVCAMVFFWAWRPRPTAFYISMVILTSFVAGNFNSLLIRAPMPLMVSDFPSRGFCSTGLGTSTSLISLTAASLVIYYDIEPDLIARGSGY